MQVYMLPEASKSGGLRLYRAEQFPMVWKLDRLLLDKPLIDASLLQVWSDLLMALPSIPLTF